MKTPSPRTSLVDRHVVVTGAASGIGRAAAEICVAAGARVALVDLDADGLESARAAIADASGAGASGDAGCYVCDISDHVAVQELFAQLDRDGFTADGLVAAAAVDIGGSSHELAASSWRAVLDVNLSGTFFVCQRVIGGLVASGRSGSLVLCSSPAASVGFTEARACAYAASKGGISALVRSLAVEYAHHGIRVNAIVPGPTETPLMWANVEHAARVAKRAEVAAEVPLGRMASAVEPARAAAWLLCDDAAYVTGSDLVCDGGVLAKASVSV